MIQQYAEWRSGCGVMGEQTDLQCAPQTLSQHLRHWEGEGEKLARHTMLKNRLKFRKGRRGTEGKTQNNWSTTEGMKKNKREARICPLLYNAGSFQQFFPIKQIIHNKTFIVQLQTCNSAIVHANILRTDKSVVCPISIIVSLWNPHRIKYYKSYWAVEA